MLVTLIQFPGLIATFNALADMPQWSEVSWLWIDNLAYPDSVGLLPFTLNFFGSQPQSTATCVDGRHLAVDAHGLNKDLSGGISFIWH